MAWPNPKSVGRFLSKLWSPEIDPPKAEPIKTNLKYTLADVRARLPKEVFKANYALSFFYIFRDAALWAGIAYLTYLGLAAVQGGALPATWVPTATVALWANYAFWMGTVGFGWWVIAHECGHYAFFGDNKLLNDVVGWFMHSILLVPYHSWRQTHAAHHRYTNLMSKDTAFLPLDEPGFFYKIGTKFPPLYLLHIALYWTLGWPTYLFLNWEGQRFMPSYKFISTTHFSPNSPLFRNADRLPVLISDIGVVATAVGLYFWAAATSWQSVALWYGLPWATIHAYLVTVTFLQHTDKRAPHYDDDKDFDFLKGALATVDRDYSWLINHLTHHITDHHVAHHVFSHVPFYNAKRITPVLAEMFPDVYLSDARPLWEQLWESWWVHASSWKHNKFTPDKYLTAAERKALGRS